MYRPYAALCYKWETGFMRGSWYALFCGMLLLNFFPGAFFVRLSNHVRSFIFFLLFRNFMSDLSRRFRYGGKMSSVYGLSVLLCAFTKSSSVRDVGRPLARMSNDPFRYTDN